MAGQPRVYATPEEMQEAVDGYFEYIRGEKQLQAGEGGRMTEVQVRPAEPATITGLALYLGFASRQSVYDYAKDGSYSYIVKNAQLRVECEYEKKLSGQQPTGSIFALKNMGWKDKTETGFTDNEGNDVSPVQIFTLPDNNRQQAPSDPAPGL